MGEYYISRITYENGLIIFTVKNANDGNYKKDYTISIMGNGKPKVINNRIVVQVTK